MKDGGYMLHPNQIKRLILHTQKQLDSLEDNEMIGADADMISYRRGFIAGLELVLNMDPLSINNNPINKEKDNDTK
jgi:hypothetical protein